MATLEDKAFVLEMVDHYNWLAQIWESVERSPPISAFLSI